MTVQTPFVYGTVADLNHPSAGILILSLSFLVSLLLSILQLLLFNLLHISYQSGYVHITDQHCNSALFA